MLARVIGFVLTTTVILAAPCLLWCDPLGANMPKDAELAELFRSHRDAFEKLIVEMKHDPIQIEPAAHAMALLRHVERLADHATNIAEDVVFIVEAKMMKHHVPENVSSRDSD